MAWVILLQNPAAWKPILYSGDVMWCQPLRVKKSPGAGYLRVLGMVVCIESKAFYGVIRFVRILPDQCKTLLRR